MSQRSRPATAAPSRAAGSRVGTSSNGAKDPYRVAADQQKAFDERFEKALSPAKELRQKRMNKSQNSSH